MHRVLWLQSRSQCLLRAEKDLSSTCSKIMVTWKKKSRLKKRLQLKLQHRKRTFPMRRTRILTNKSRILKSQASKDQ